MKAIDPFNSFHDFQTPGLEWPFAALGLALARLQIGSSRSVGRHLKFFRAGYSWIKEKFRQNKPDKNKKGRPSEQMETPRGFNPTNESSEFPKVTSSKFHLAWRPTTPRGELGSEMSTRFAMMHSGMNLRHHVGGVCQNAMVTIPY